MRTSGAPGAATGAGRSTSVSSRGRAQRRALTIATRFGSADCGAGMLVFRMPKPQALLRPLAAFCAPAASRNGARTARIVRVALNPRLFGCARRVSRPSQSQGERARRAFRAPPPRLSAKEKRHGIPTIGQFGAEGLDADAWHDDLRR